MTTTASTATATSYLDSARSFVSSIFAISSPSSDTLLLSTDFSQSNFSKSWGSTALWTAAAVTALVGSVVAYRAYGQSGNGASAESDARGRESDKPRELADLTPEERKAYDDESNTIQNAHYASLGQIEVVFKDSLVEVCNKYEEDIRDAQRAEEWETAEVLAKRVKSEVQTHVDDRVTSYRSAEDDRDDALHALRVKYLSKE